MPILRHPICELEKTVNPFLIRINELPQVSISESSMSQDTIVVLAILIVILQNPQRYNLIILLAYYIFFY